MARPTLDFRQELLERRSPREYLITGVGHGWSYDALYREVTERALALADWGVGPGHRVALSISDPAEFVVWFLALLASEAVVVPLNPAAPDDDVRRTLDKSGSTDLFDGQHPPTPLVPRPLPVKSGERAGVILLTSGSTGDPKPVGLPLSALWHTAGEVAQAHRLNPQDRGYSPLPLFHINALVVAVLGSLRAGSTIAIPHGGFHASEFWEQIDEWGITWINGVPSILMVLAQRSEMPIHPERIRFIRSASAPLPAATRGRIEARFGIGVVETYGMTEASSQITANVLPDEGTISGSVGLPRGIDVRVVDDLGRPVAHGDRGSVEIRGPGVLDPNWGPNHWARRVMKHGWYPTGDLGHLDARGFLYLDGRSRELINRGGEKIFPREVEEWLLNHPAVADCAVVGRPHAILGEEPVAFLVARDEEALTIPGIDEWAEEGLARFKRPAEYFVVKSLPKGSTGKIARQDLRRQVGGGGGFKR